MRRISLLAGGAVVLMVGCGLVGTYDYDGYQNETENGGGSPTSSSSNTSTSSGSGGSAGSGGGDGGGVECPPDLCNDNNPDTCRGKPDCLFNATFAERKGDNTHQQVNAMYALPSGEILVAGQYEGNLSIGGLSLANVAIMNEYPFYAKIAANGTAVFAKHIPMNGRARSIVEAENGIYIAGQLTPNGMMPQTFIRKTAPNGNYDPINGIGWEKQFGESSSLGTIAVLHSNDSTGRIFVVGNKTGDVSLPCVGITDPNATEAFLMEISPDSGICKWGKVYPGIAAMSATILETSIIIGGIADRMITLPNGTKVAVKGGIASAHTFDGSNSWIKNFDPMNANETVGLIRATSDASHIYFTGTFMGTFQVASTTLVASDFNIFVMSLSPDGTAEWARYFGGTGLQAPTALMATGNSLYLAGATQSAMTLVEDSNSGPICNSGTGYCMFLMNLSNNGKTILGQEFSKSGTASDMAHLAHSKDGSLWLAGSWEGQGIDFGSGLLMPGGNRDVIIAKFPASTLPD